MMLILSSLSVGRMRALNWSAPAVALPFPFRTQNQSRCHWEQNQPAAGILLIWASALHFNAGFIRATRCQMLQG